MASKVSLTVLMVKSAKHYPAPSFTKDILILVGGYGSGKSEVAVNLARHLASSNSEPVAIADLDIVNPYFRSREAEEGLAVLGITPLNPRGDYKHADLPVLLPEISGTIRHHRGKVVLDVGGDDVGARVLSALAGAFRHGEYELLLVLNANRPFTQDTRRCLELMKNIETSSRLEFTGIIANTHLLTETTAHTVLSGLKLAQEVAGATRLPVVFLSVLEEVLGQMGESSIKVPVLVMNRHLLKPWERSQEAAGDSRPRSER